MCKRRLNILSKNTFIIFGTNPYDDSIYNLFNFTGIRSGYALLENIRTPDVNNFVKL